MLHSIVYCDRCGKMIPPDDVTLGQAIVGDVSGVCPSCVAVAFNVRNAMREIKGLTFQMRIRGFVLDEQLNAMLNEQF